VPMVSAPVRSMRGSIPGLSSLSDNSMIPKEL
jgi:hypothetical protein